MQQYLSSVEGTVLSGKLTAQAINAQANQEARSSTKQLQTLQPSTNAATV
ncbi:amine oxidase [Calothrix sp. NIES-3974]|nr:amine oxidase [Calothrix sp. NIES-3974]